MNSQQALDMIFRKKYPWAGFIANKKWPLLEEFRFFCEKLIDVLLNRLNDIQKCYPSNIYFQAGLTRFEAVGKPNIPGYEDPLNKLKMENIYLGNHDRICSITIYLSLLYTFSALGILGGGYFIGMLLFIMEHLNHFIK